MIEIDVVCIIQRQLDSLSTFVRQRLRSTGQRTTTTSESCVQPAATAPLEDRSAAGESAEQRGPPAVVDVPVTAGYDGAQQRQRPVSPPPNSYHRTSTQVTQLQ